MITVGLTRDIAACHALRRRVFIEEQGVDAALDLDGLDDAATHLLAVRDGVPSGTARLIVQGDVGKIGRVCVLPEARGLGVGAALMRAAVTEFRKLPGVRRVKLGAQAHALAFYERLGFAATGPEYLDAGIAHRDMVLEL